MTRSDEKASTSETVARALSPECLRQLGEQFSFDSVSPERARRLRRIGRLYLATSHLQQSGQEWAAEDRKEFQKLQRQVVELQKQLETLASDIPLILSLGKMATQEEFDARLAKEKSSKIGNRILTQELSRPLELLNAGLEIFTERLAPRPGRKCDDGLTLFVRHVANFWIEELGRDFTLDYEKGSGTTQAFLFVKTLLSPIADIPDTRIVTAMRAEIAARQKIARGERP